MALDERHASLLAGAAAAPAGGAGEAPRPPPPRAWRHLDVQRLLSQRELTGVTPRLRFSPYGAGGGEDVFAPPPLVLNALQVRVRPPRPFSPFLVKVSVALGCIPFLEALHAFRPHDHHLTRSLLFPIPPALQSAALALRVLPRVWMKAQVIAEARMPPTPPFGGQLMGGECLDEFRAHGTVLPQCFISPLFHRLILSSHCRLLPLSRRRPPRFVTNSLATPSAARTRRPLSRPWHATS